MYMPRWRMQSDAHIIYGVAAMSSLIILVPLRRGERNVDKLGLRFYITIDTALR